MECIHVIKNWFYISPVLVIFNTISVSIMMTVCRDIIVNFAVYIAVSSGWVAPLWINCSYSSQQLNHVCHCVSCFTAHNHFVLIISLYIMTSIPFYKAAVIQFFSFTLPQVFDVFTQKPLMLKDSTDFVVSVNPTGVVMWYVSAPAKLNLRQFFKGGKLRASSSDDSDENSIPRVFLWAHSDRTLSPCNDITLCASLQGLFMKWYFLLIHEVPVFNSKLSYLENIALSIPSKNITVSSGTFSLFSVWNSSQILNLQHQHWSSSRAQNKWILIHLPL